MEGCKGNDVANGWSIWRATGDECTSNKVDKRRDSAEYHLDHHANPATRQRLPKLQHGEITGASGKALGTRLRAAERLREECAADGEVLFSDGGEVGESTLHFATRLAARRRCAGTEVEEDRRHAEAHRRQTPINQRHRHQCGEDDCNTRRKIRCRIRNNGLHA